MKYVKRKIKIKIVPLNCPFCNTKTEPNFKDLQQMGKYVSDRGRILAHTRTGVCSKHQRAISECVKHARHVAMLPFVA